METLIFDNVKCSYWLTGDKKNPPLLILPGFSGIHQDLVPLANQFKNKYFVIIPDLPGWGESEKLKMTHSLENYALFIKQILFVEKIKKIILFGHCMGATLAIEHAFRYPKTVRKLILVSPPYEEGVFMATIIKWLINTSKKFPKNIRPIFHLWRNRYLGFILSFVILKFKTFKKILEMAIKNYNSQVKEDRQVAEENWISLINFDYQKIKSLKMPIKLIYGLKDLLISQNQAKKLNMLLSSPSLEFIPEAGHLAPIETPRQTVNITKKFIRESEFKGT
jgi:pimeloyl-ACP methyl ester carboxylesterase